MVNHACIFIEGKGVVDFGHILGTVHQAPVAKLIATLLDKNIEFSDSLPPEGKAYVISRGVNLSHIALKTPYTNFKYYTDCSVCYRENGFLYVYSRVYSYDHIYAITIHKEETIDKMDKSDIQAFWINKLFISYERVAKLYSKYSIGLNRKYYRSTSLHVFDCVKSIINCGKNKTLLSNMSFLEEKVGEFLNQYTNNEKYSSKVCDDIRETLKNDFVYSKYLLLNNRDNTVVNDAAEYLAIAIKYLDVTRHSKIIITLFRNIINIGTYLTINDYHHAYIETQMYKYIDILNEKIIPNLLTQIWFARKKEE